MPDDSTYLPLQAIRSHFKISFTPGLFEPIHIAGIEGWRCSHPHSTLSLVRWTTNIHSVAEKSVDQVIQLMRQNHNGFHWLTDPMSAEHGLDELLDVRGFGESQKVTAMTLSNPPLITEARQPIRTWELPASEEHTCASVMSNGFDVPFEVAVLFHRAYTGNSNIQKSRIFAAAPVGLDQPVSIGYISYLGSSNSVLLRVACTLKEYRRQGLYKELVLRRIKEAVADGAGSLFVHSYSSESAECLKSFGFSEVALLGLRCWNI